jgi:hypothetical protein
MSEIANDRCAGLTPLGQWLRYLDIRMITEHAESWAKPPTSDKVFEVFQLFNEPEFFKFFRYTLGEINASMSDTNAALTPSAVCI